MALLSAAKRLFIPNKTQPEVRQPEYGNDMRAIEIFNPINHLIAGSGVTLTPADGTGPEVEIAATGGGGGNGTGAWEFDAGPDPTDFSGGGGPPFGIPFSGVSMPSTGVNETSQWLTMDEPSLGGIHRQYCFTCSWLWNIFAGDAATFLPLILRVPQFTGSIDITFSIFALRFDLTDIDIWTTNVTTYLASPINITVTDTDFVNNPAPTAGDFSLVPAGLVTASGGVCFGASQAIVTVSPGTTFP